MLRNTRVVFVAHAHCPLAGYKLKIRFEISLWFYLQAKLVKFLILSLSALIK